MPTISHQPKPLGRVQKGPMKALRLPGEVVVVLHFTNGAEDRSKVGIAGVVKAQGMNAPLGGDGLIESW